jgi:hypothetical protein
MKGSVISYLVHAESDSLSHFRFHDVLDVNDEDAVRDQVQSERGELPAGAHLEWYR